MNSPSQHRARKRFGQNFLTDTRIIMQIIAGIAPGKGQHLVEIGPGKGAITRELLPLCGRLDAIELDRDLVPLLQKMLQDSKFNLHSADALKFDFCQLQQDGKLRIVGNLPYNISTPLIFHLLDKADCIADMHFMLQKEVVDRLAASPNSKAYSKLSVMTQAQCEVAPLFEIPPQAFDPAPKVQSAFVRLVPRSELPVSEQEWVSFETLVTAAFAHRRKTLRNNLKKLVDIESAEKEIDLTRRAESLSIDEFVKLSRFLLT